MSFHKSYINYIINIKKAEIKIKFTEVKHNPQMILNFNYNLSNFNFI